MKRAFIITAVLALTACQQTHHEYHFACESVAPDHLGAVYTVSHQQDTGTPTDTTLTLWRADKRVAHQHTTPPITTAWAQDRKGGLLTWQHFDDAQRTIEYEAQHLSAEQSLSAWQEKWQIVADSFRGQLEKTGRSGVGCNTAEHYRQQQKPQTVALDWLPQLQLPANFEVSDEKGKISWRLEKIISDRNTVSHVFLERDRWQSTDYADIGDSESDPFLLSMINLGFIEHGAEGFYNSEGEHIHREHGH